MGKKYILLDIYVYFVYCPTVHCAFLCKATQSLIKFLFLLFLCSKQANVTGNVHIFWLWNQYVLYIQYAILYIKCIILLAVYCWIAWSIFCCRWLLHEQAWPWRTGNENNNIHVTFLTDLNIHITIKEINIWIIRFLKVNIMSYSWIPFSFPPISPVISSYLQAMMKPIMWSLPYLMLTVLLVSCFSLSKILCVFVCVSVFVHCTGGWTVTDLEGCCDICFLYYLFIV